MKHKCYIQCNTKNLSDLRKFLDEVLRQYSLGDIDRNAVILAVDEVCANIIIHVYDNDNTKRIEMRVFPQNNKLVFEIVDKSGVQFDINAYDEPELKEIIKSRKKGGVGLMLVRRIMDKIELDTDGGKNVCRLYKSMPRS